MALGSAPDTADFGVRLNSAPFTPARRVCSLPRTREVTLFGEGSTAPLFRALLDIWLRPMPIG
ncbi:hypothetical protein GCM10010433_00190 [Streptomyces pulveraceus]